MIKQSKKWITLVLALIMFAGVFAGCTGGGDDDDELLPDVTDNNDTSTYTAADEVFSLNCSKENGFNPYATANANNLLVTQLMYDMVFDVDASFAVSSKAIASWSSEDGMHWRLDVDPDVKFWDGSSLTAADVVYSIQRAQRSSVYKSRLSTVVGTTAMDETYAAITIAVPNMQFPSLLTIPIIKYGSIDDPIPMGTGPYILQDDLSKLIPNADYPTAADMPFDEVYLKEVPEIENAIMAFENSEIDLVLNDPTALSNLGYSSANEIRTYATTNMHYIGFNSSSMFFSSIPFRQAMTYIINREHISNDIMSGNAIEAALPMNPSSALYNSGYSDLISYSVKKSEAALEQAQVSDFDDDGVREIMVTGIQIEMNINFIVCSDSPQKVQAAKSIADNMMGLGIQVTLNELSWDDYNAALKAGAFDMYYAETKLKADFDPSSLVLQNQALNFGKFNDSGLAEHIAAYMSANDADRKKAADLMYKYLSDMSPIVTICFEKHQVITHRGVISGMRPTQYNVFNSLEEWNIDSE